MKKWKEKEKQFVREHKDTMSRAKIAEALGLSPEEGRKVSFLIRRMKLKKEKTGKKQEKPNLEQVKKATTPVSAENSKTSIKVKKVKGITGTKGKVAKIGQKKYKTISVQSLIKKDSKDYENELTLLFQAIRKCVLKDTSTYLSGHSKLRYVSHGFFVKLSTNEYLLYVEDGDNSYFVRTGIFNGESVLKGESAREKLENRKKEYLKEEK